MFNEPFDPIPISVIGSILQVIHAPIWPIAMIVCTMLNQPLNHIRFVIFSRTKQNRQAALVFCVYVSSVFNEPLNQFPIPFFSC